MPSPSLTVSLLPPEEAELYQAIRYETFRPTINKILYASEPSQATHEYIASSTRNDIVNKGILYLKCVENSTRQIIAGARWRYLGLLNPDGTPAPRSEEQLEKDLEVPEPYTESNPALYRQIFSLFNHNKKEIMGTRPHYVLDTLVTHPDHHRKGAGGLLVKWGCDKADELGVEAYVEASPMGQPLYARHGFVPVKECGIDLRDYGGDEELRFIVSIS